MKFRCPKCKSSWFGSSGPDFETITCHGCGRSAPRSTKGMWVMDEVEVDAKGLLILDAETIIESGIACKTCDKWGVTWTGKSHGIERTKGTTCWYDCEDDICGTGQDDFFCRLHSKLQGKDES